MSPPRPKAGNQRQAASIWAAAHVVSTLIDRFGWPGGIAICGFVFVVVFGSLEQKRAIIDRLVLGSGQAQFYTQAVLLGLGVVLFVAQQAYYAKRVGVMQEEIDRLSSMKSARQEHQIGAGNLHHTNGKKKGKGRSV